VRALLSNVRLSAGWPSGWPGFRLAFRPPGFPDRWRDNYTGIIITDMVRQPLSPEERARGEALGALLRAGRGERTMVEVAAVAGVPVETLRKIESGRIPTPAFFTVVAVAGAIGLSLEQIVARCAATPEWAAAA
jgi:hypothetical protein